jgi:putative membrane protein
MSEPRRLHASAFLVHALKGLQDVIVPLVVALFVGARSFGTGTLIALAAVVASLVLGWLRWRATTYWVQDGALHFRSGVLSPDTQVVPIARIAAVDEVQGPIQRLFRVVALHVQTAGGGAGGEIVLAAVSHEAAAALRAALDHPARDVAAGANGDAAGRAAEWQLSNRGLLLAALTGPQLGVLAPVAGAAAALGQQVFGQDRAGELLQRLPHSLHTWVLLGIAIAAAALLLSLLGAVVVFGGFVVRREPGRLRLQRGLLQRRAATVGIERVHAIRVVEGLLRAPLGLCSVRLEVAGYAREHAAAQTLIPLCRRAEVAGLLTRLVPELPLPQQPPQRPPARAWRRYVVTPALLFAAAGALAAAEAWAAGAPAVVWLAPLVVGLAVAAVGQARWRAAGWWRYGGVVAIRSRRILARVTTVAAVRRLQHRQLSASLPARRAGLASVRFAVASGAAAAVAHLERAVAGELLGALGPGLGRREA